MLASALAALVGVGIPSAAAQSIADTALLPTTAASVRLGDLRQHYEQLAAAAGGSAVASGPRWRISPALDLTESYTDNAGFSSGGSVVRTATGLQVIGGSGGGGDFITTITPGVLVNGDSARVKVNLSYSPNVTLYARNSSLGSIGQNLNGQASVTVVPETVFLDLRAFASTQSITGGTGPTNFTSQSRSNQAQQYSFIASPYVQHRFGGAGTAEIGYSLSYSTSDTLEGFSGNPPVSQQFLLQSGLQGNTDQITQTEHAVFRSGEDLGRVSLAVSVSATQYSGGPLYDGAHSDLQAIDVGYAVSRFVSLLGRIGHEDIAFNGVPPLRIDDGVWSAGAKLTPHADSTLTLTYGHRYGARNILVDGSYAATARLHLYGRYSQALSTGLEDLQSALASIDVDDAGGLYDHQTGAPVILADNFFGVQNSLNRTDRGSMTAVLIYARDSFSLGFVRENRKVVSAVPGAVQGGSSRGTYGTLGWQHDLSPAVRTNTYLQYGTQSPLTGLQTTGTNGDNEVLVASASLTYALSETLSTNALYSYSRNPAFNPGTSSTQNLVLVGLHKRF